MAEQKYILRYYLPIKPYFDEEYTEKRFAELLSFCEKTKTDAVMLYVALSPDWYYMPDTVEYARECRDQMLPYIQRLREAGISYQLNFQNLVGSTLGGVDFSKQYDWEKFRAHAGERLRIWAETKPDIIWIDDDLRLHNHGTPVIAKMDGEGSYIDYYCYCEKHLEKFNEKYGTAYDRETLVKEMTVCGEASDIRKKYLEFLSETVEDTAKWIRETVQGTSPNTKLAQMTSKPDVHAAEGRNWERFLTALCGEYAPIIRAHFGPYTEKLPTDFVKCYRLLAQTIAQVRQTYSGPVAYCPEVENTRFTTWAKSSNATAFQLALSAFMGCEGITLSMYDLEGGSFLDEPLYEEMLVKCKSFLDKVVALDLGKKQEKGVVIPMSWKSGKNYRFQKGETYETMGGTKRYMDVYLLKAGIPCSYREVSEVETGDVVALDSYAAGFLSDEELTVLLKGKVFLDGEAARILYERGFGEQIGITAMQKQKIFVNAEVIHTHKRKDDTYIRIPSRIPNMCWYACELSENAETVSTFLTPVGEEYPGMIRYGDVVIYPAVGDWGDGFFTHHRVDLFKKVFQSLSATFPIIEIHSYALSVVKGEYYFVANLSTDVRREVTINGKKIACKLGVYGVLIYNENTGEVWTV